MEQMIAVLHDGALAQYSYEAKEKGVYVLWLQRYKGSKEQQPPAMLVLHKEGRHWYSEGHQQEMIADLGYAIEEQNRIYRA
ncbi:MAG: hypothetical protein M3342_15435 [Bacteroidota bacterium]|nr:hypothetical protein [Flavisolibacter sp.]MBD0284462.1 hypothetical protein [Flavisolibacter sp.]MBD0294594.1 hypothetical protein [Flavisolibacter sp.]MDQ3845380.1 hypothetical protein [Bacteroidota bacterium]